MSLPALARLAALAAFTTTLLPAQTPRLVKDLNATPIGNTSGDPVILGQVGNQVLLSGTTPEYGTAIYKSTLGLTQPKLIRHFRNRGWTAPIQKIAATSQYVFFLRGYELWRSDGTAAGTIRIANMRRAFRAYQIPSAAATSTHVAFVYDDRSSPFTAELWLSDGSVQGTTSLANLEPHSLTRHGSHIYFSARSSALGFELWRTNGRKSGTAIYKDIVVGAKSSYPTGLTVHGADLYFTTYDFPSGGVLVRRLSAGKVSVVIDPDGTSPGWNMHPPRYASVGTRLFFTAGTATKDKYALFVTSGTPATTRKLKDLTGVPHMIGAAGSRAVAITRSINNTTFDVWSSDGTIAGTTRVQRVTGQIGSESVSYNNRLLFTALTAANGLELWSSDGSATGTKLLYDIHPGAGRSNPARLTVLPASVLFSANDGQRGQELWTTQGSTATTRLLFDFQPTTRKTVDSQVTTIASNWWFAELNVRNNLWLTDGSTTGTQRLLTGNLPFLAVSATLGGDAYTAYPTQLTPRMPAGLLKSDGTIGGTSALVGGPIYSVARLRGHLYFSDSSGKDLWQSDGTKAGTRSIHANSPVRYGRLQATQEALYFSSGFALYRSNADGKTPIELYRGRQIWDLTTLDRQVYFATPPTGSSVLYFSDGTKAGTRIVKTASGVTPNPWSPLPRFDINGVFYFIGGTPAQGLELWRTDGTNAGTRLMKDIQPGPGGALARSRALHRHGDLLLFFADDGKSGMELWRSDGTATGTVMVKDIAPGKLDSQVNNYTSVIISAGRYAWFAANDHKTGTELWRTDGTAQGTTLVADIGPGDLPSNPDEFALIRGQLLFRATHPAAGRELMAIDPGAHAQPIGNGCAALIPPQLAATPPQLGATLDITVSKSTGTRGVLLWGTTYKKATHLGNGCTTYVDLASPYLAIPFRPNTQGRWTLRLTVPSTPALHGLNLPMQAGVGPTATAPLATDFTNGVLLAIRR